ncbi:peptidase [Candidatus Paraluminiphilus aquimaris]|uniref:Peptidase n=1 Tax=Candidatus Paraluminiphilus aquimaris TaxID=2518994 RepID=A0ABY6Q2U0_9GAMM|nr:M14 family zinc carboxypeptidase [Candidatus Paraluminiphilus aquimaris]UZP73502.1 peptidase [Candidatus Paraluminiphilus aquimaris]
MKRLLLPLLLIFNAPAFAQSLTLSDIFDKPPVVNASIPTPEEVTGVRVGERHWYHYEIVNYLNALAEASPRMVALGEHARSYGGRPLVSYALSTPENLARLDEIKRARSAIIDPEADVDLNRQPAVLHMMYSIHGNEPSGANATPLVAYYLNAALDDALLAQLEDVVIIFNPMLNPDGLDRFAYWSNAHRGVNPSFDSNDREHVQSVPNGRTNYYWFDLNRDWLPHQHPESRGRLALFHEWKPNVQLDFHEQGSNSNFFFMPGKPERTNPLTPKINQLLTAKIGEYHAAAFDAEGVRFFTEEGYDDFFMGKGSTYPDLFGTVGILFEQPSSRGAGQSTLNGELTFPFSISNQFRASLSSLKATAELKDDLLDYQRNFYAKQKRSRGHYLASTEGDSTRLQEFVRILKGHQIEVETLANDVTAEGQVFKAGQAIAIPLDQPQATYLETLWRAQLEFEENVFYDVSTWTLPWAFNLSHTREPVRNAKTKALAPSEAGQALALAESPIGYLIDWRDANSPALLYDLLEAGANVRVAKAPFTALTTNEGAVNFGYGTLFVAPELQESIPEAALSRLSEAVSKGLGVYPAASSYTPEGIDLGSRDFDVLSLPNVVLVTGPGTSAYGTGEIWHLLDTRVDMPITMVDSHNLKRVELDRYTHVIMTTPLRAAGATAQLDAFVKNGGVLWLQGASTVAWAAGEGLTEATWRETPAQRQAAELKRARNNKASPEAQGALLPERKPFSTASDEYAFTLVRGAILQGNLDTSHPLGYGYTSSELAVFRTTNRFMNPSSNAYSSPIVYTDSPLLSGYMSEENRTLVANSAGLVVDERGQGAVVLSLDSPTFRAFWWGTQRLLVNGIFFGDLLEEPR